MTDRDRKAFDNLPPEVMAQIYRLARLLKESPQSIIERAIQLLEQNYSTARTVAIGLENPAPNPFDDPKSRAVFKRMMSALAKRTAAAMTPAQKRARGKAGAAGRAKKLTAPERKDIARRAAQKRWAKAKKEG